MTSPYVAREARRLHIVASDRASWSRPASPSCEALEGEVAVAGSRASEGRRGSIIGSKAEHRPGDYRFARQRSDAIPLEKSPPLTSRSAAILRGMLIALVFAAMWAFTSGAAWWLTSGG